MTLDFYDLFFLFINLVFFFVGVFIALPISNFFRRFFYYWNLREDETFFQILKKTFPKDEIMDD